MGRGGDLVAPHCSPCCGLLNIASGSTVPDPMNQRMCMRIRLGHEAKLWFGPVQLSWNRGFREAELRGIVRILATHEAKLIEAWNETE